MVKVIISMSVSNGFNDFPLFHDKNMVSHVKRHINIILLLDESTASLDADNEERINRALDHLMKGKTVFVIAHRLNTIQNADQIILLNNGNIEEIGIHLELLKKRGHFYSMIQEQEKAKAWIVKGE